MAQSALTTEDVDTVIANARTLDMPMFWSKPTIYPGISINKWKDELIVSLFAKTMTNFFPSSAPNFIKFTL